MWKYIRRYLHFALLAAVLMFAEVIVSLLQPDLMSVIVDKGVLGVDNGGVSDLGIVWQTGLKMICLVAGGGLCGILNNVFFHITSQNIGNDMRKDAFSSVMRFTFSQMEKFGTGSIITRITNDVTQVQNFIAQFFRGMIRTSMLTVGSIFFMFRLSLKFGIIVVCIVPFIVAVLFFCLKSANPKFYTLQAQLDMVNSIMQEDISGIRIIKACVREGYEDVRFGKANGELIKTQLSVLMLFAFMNPTVNLLINLIITLIFVAGAGEVALGNTSPGSIMAAVTYASSLLNGIMGLTMISQNISRGMASWRRLSEILHSSPWMENGSIKSSSGAEGEIEFKNVSFSYPGSTLPVLKDISFHIRPGETVAILGETGCGKSSLINLIPRFYDVSGGEVKVDGTDVRSYDQRALRSKIAVIAQESELFGMSIKDNIAWGHSGAAPDEIVAAAKTAQADDFISSMPDGYDTIVAERGNSLSGGQKQRISIARAILKKAEIMIFDDSTSALDLRTESELYKAINASFPGITKIIVAQRIASVRLADRIIVLSNGGIEGCGTHDELMRSSTIYREIYESQLGEEACNG